MFDLEKTNENYEYVKLNIEPKNYGLFTSTNAPCPGSNDNILTATILFRQFAL